MGAFRKDHKKKKREWVCAKVHGGLLLNWPCFLPLGEKSNAWKRTERMWNLWACARRLAVTLKGICHVKKAKSCWKVWSTSTQMCLCIAVAAFCTSFFTWILGLLDTAKACMPLPKFCTFLLASKAPQHIGGPIGKVLELYLAFMQSRSYWKLLQVFAGTSGWMHFIPFSGFWFSGQILSNLLPTV